MIAEDIPADNYEFRPVEGTKTMDEILIYIALGARFQEQIILVEKRTSMEGFTYFQHREALMAEVNKPRTTAEIITLLKYEGEKRRLWSHCPMIL